MQRGILQNVKDFVVESNQFPHQIKIVLDEAINRPPMIERIVTNVQIFEINKF